MSDETAAPESTPAPAPRLGPGEGPGTSTGATADPASETAPIHGPPSTVDAAPVDLRSPALYVNRELSWLEFNRRGLHEAPDPRTPPPVAPPPPPLTVTRDLPGLESTRGVCQEPGAPRPPLQPPAVELEPGEL